MSVCQPAVGHPQAGSGISVTDYFKDKLSRDNVVLVPEKSEFSGEPQKILGEQAEKTLCDLIEKCKHDIPGVKIICFHGIRVISGSPSIIREVDNCCFITYQGRQYVLISEVKCNKQSKTSGAARKKAIHQLETFKDMLRSELSVSEGVEDNFQLHAVWPNMPPTEPCPVCAGRHPSLYERPPACQQPGTQRRANPEPDGFHLFQDKTVGDTFSDWMRSIISDPSKAVKSEIYEGALGFVTRHCVGVLYDQSVGMFCILGSDQSKLVARAEQPLDNPLVIYGLSGTGKTISILARIQHISPKLDENHKVLFICFEDNVIEMVRMKLKACQIDLSYVSFENFNSRSCQLGDIFKEENKFQELVDEGYRYIYVDSAEDLGIDAIEDIIQKVLGQNQSHHNALELQNLQVGDFWITVDPFQGLKDGHSMVRGLGKTINWQGNAIKTSVLLEKGFEQRKFIKLNESFRMPLNLIKHIEAKNVLPTKTLPSAPDVPTQGVLEERLEVPDIYHLGWLAKQVANRLHQRVMKRGIHPGHCAVLYEGRAVDTLFPTAQGGLPAFICKVNGALQTISVQSQARHMLQLTQDMKESVIFGHNFASSTDPLLTEVSSTVASEDTVEFQCEQHAQVLASSSAKLLSNGS